MLNILTISCYNEKRDEVGNDRCQQESQGILMSSKEPQQPAQLEPFLTDESIVVQPDLFHVVPLIVAEPPDTQGALFPPLIRTHPLTEQSSLSACALPYQQELGFRRKS